MACARESLHVMSPSSLLSLMQALVLKSIMWSLRLPLSSHILQHWEKNNCFIKLDFLSWFFSHHWQQPEVCNFRQKKWNTSFLRSYNSHWVCKEDYRVQGITNWEAAHWGARECDIDIGRPIHEGEGPAWGTLSGISTRGDSRAGRAWHPQGQEGGGN